MRQHETFVSLDIGTTSIKVVVAEYINGSVNIIGVGNEKSRGLSRGVIVDIDETVYSIQRAVDQASRKANYQIRSVIVGVPSNQIMIEECHGMVAVASENREITNRDVDNVISAAKVRSVPPERDIISIIPEEFIVDGFNGIKDPRGMLGVRLELYARLVTGPRTIIHNIRRCVQKAGLEIAELVVQPQAISSVALSRDEREFGTVIIDMGGGQTTASIIHDNQLKYTMVDQEGGDFVTKDISIILNTSIESAERIKREYGYAVSADTSDQEYFPVETVGKKEPVRVDEHFLAEIIEARMVQIFETLHDELQRVDGLDLPGGFVMTGGGVSLPGVVELAKRYFGNQIRVFIPDEMGMRNPIYATSLGLINYVAQLDDIHRIAQGTYSNLAYSNQEMHPPYAQSRQMEGPVGRSTPAASSQQSHAQTWRDDDYFSAGAEYEQRNSAADNRSQLTNRFPNLFGQREKNQGRDEQYPYQDYNAYPTSSVGGPVEESNDYRDNYYREESYPKDENNFMARIRNYFNTFFD